MNLILSFTFADVCWIIAVLLIVSLVVMNIFRKNEIKTYKEEINFSDGDLTINEQYLDIREVIFYEYLQRSVPSNCVCFPRVGVDNIVKPKGSKNFYKSILSKYVDFVVFNKSTMTPILYVDLYDDSIDEQIIKEQDKNIENALIAVKLPKLSVKIDKNNIYDIDKLKYDIASKIDPVNLALLKNSN